jgi:fatty acid desaturase
MRTITDYSSMVFTHVPIRTLERARRQRRLRFEFLAVLVYATLGILLSLDTGFAPWQWQFWIVFAPLFLAGELLWRKFTF